MANEFNQDMTSENITPTDPDAEEISFEQEMLRIVQRDYKAGLKFMDKFYRACNMAYQAYYSANQYTDLRKKNKFPMPFFQDQIDTFVDYMMDKIYYKDQPCTIVGTEETDKADANAKQALFNWQDHKDGIKAKIEQAIRDAAMYRISVGQIDYTNKTKRKLRGVQEPIIFGGVDTGQVRSRTEVKEEVVFRGATVKRIDPLDLVITQDKTSMDDGEPVMIRSRKTLDYFKSKNYFFNVNELKTLQSSGEDDENDIKYNKRMIRDLEPEQRTARNALNYVEWQGIADKFKLYKYLGTPTEIQQQDPNTGEIVNVPVCLPGDKTEVICGIVEGKVVVRLEEHWLEADGGNVVIGILQTDEDEILGTGIADKISAVSQGMDTLMGILLENFKQSVNAQHVINKNAIISGADTLMNKAGGILLTNDNVLNVHKRIDQPRVAPDIQNLISMFSQMGRDASGGQKIISTGNEAGLETLGQSNIALGQSMLRMNRYLGSFESTFIEPLYNIRNQINMQFLDQEYVYGVIGKGAIEWRTIQPEQIRANVDFMCESSTRETNRIVITQQILQVIKFAPAMQQMGFPIRMDKLMKQLVELGFSWSPERTQDIFPSLKLEEQGIDVDSLLLQNMMVALQMNMLNTVLGEQPKPESKTNDKNTPEPKSESDANKSASKKNETKIGKA